MAIIATTSVSMGGRVFAYDEFYSNNDILFYAPGATNSTPCVNNSVVISNLPDTVPEPYRSLFTKAALAYNTSPAFITTLFLTENGNAWKPFDSNWSTSKAGASGPFQFMPGTWDGYGVDGNNDGSIDINNMDDSAFAAANYVSKNGVTNSTVLGDINKPFAPGTLLITAAAYNWGGGNVKTKTTAETALNDTVVPQETQHYLSNIYWLISSGFTKSGYAAYGDPVPPSGASTTTGVTASTSPCNGAVAGNIVQTAINYAWPEYHQADYLEMKPSYKAAVSAAQIAGKYVGGGDNPGIDCGGFVTRVMQDSGVDPNYGGGSNVVSQYEYVKNSPDYQEIINPTETDLRPGDIAIKKDLGHTYLYVGTVANFDNKKIASASYLSWRSPMAGMERPADPDYYWFRHK